MKAWTTALASSADKRTYHWAELTQLVVATATYGSDMVGYSESAVENDTKNRGLDRVSVNGVLRRKSIRRRYYVVDHGV